MAVVQYEQIVVSREGAVSVVVLNRPERLNAWTPYMAEEMAHAIAAANDDAAVGAVVITGAGRGFCAGADMEHTFGQRLEGRDPGNDTAAGFGGMPKGLDWVRFIRESKPIVAAVNGPAIGVGVTMILPADQIVASTASRFGMGFIKMGLVPELASTRLLGARVGFGRASDLFLSGRVISGEEAHRIGLADQLAEPDDLVPTALAVANSYAANPDLQLQMTKQLLTANMHEQDWGVVQEREMTMLKQCWTSPEHKEAVAAFIAKRPPVFRPQA